MIEKKRIDWLDIARSIAIVSVTFNHAVNRSFNIYSNQMTEFLQIPRILSVLKVVIYTFSRMGVPLFLMISGALLLPRNYEGKRVFQFLRHNWLKLFITTEIWLAIMYCYKQLTPTSVLYTEGVLACIIRFIMTLLFINPVTMGSMWYMPMILCVYLLIPILAVALKKIDGRYFLLPVLLVVFCSFLLPDINGAMLTIGVTESLETTLESSNIFSMFVVYLLLGYWISAKEVLKVLKTRTVVLGLVSSYAAFNIFQMWIYTKEYDYVVGEGYHSIFPLITAVFLFELLRRLSYTDRVSELAASLSRSSFGIYFLHVCILEGVVALITYFGWDILYLWKFLVLEVASFFGSVIIIMIVGKSNRLAEVLFGIK